MGVFSEDLPEVPSCSGVEEVRCRVVGNESGFIPLGCFLNQGEASFWVRFAPVKKCTAFDESPAAVGLKLLGGVSRSEGTDVRSTLQRNPSTFSRIILKGKKKVVSEVSPHLTQLGGKTLVGSEPIFPITIGPSCSVGTLKDSRSVVGLSSHLGSNSFCTASPEMGLNNLGRASEGPVVLSRVISDLG